MSKVLYVSASAIETASPKEDGCYRKWWLQKIAKMPQLPRESSIFGDVIHGVCERFLKADDNGCDTNGHPVNLYPTGWEYPIDRFSGVRNAQGVSLSEQALIKDLIATAISEGILMRVPGRQIEKTISSWKILEGVLVNGYIDLLEPAAIVDHKSTKDIKYAKSVKPSSPNSLYNNIQLNLYAYWAYTKGIFNKESTVSLRHNYFIKNTDKPKVESRTVNVTWEHVQEFFTESIQPVIEMMISYRDCEKLTDIPLPSNVASACRKYGGCEFASICTEQETVNDYKNRVNKVLTLSIGDFSGESKMPETMAEKIARMKASRAGGASIEPAPAPAQTAPQSEAAAPVIETEVVEDKRQEQVTAPKTQTQRAPWHIQGCKACSESDILGMKPDGSAPCMMCVVWARKSQLPLPSDFEWCVDEGKLIVMDKQGNEVMTTITNNTVASKQQESEKPVTTPAKTTPAAAKPAAVAEQPAPEPEAAAPQTAPATAPASEKRVPFENVEMIKERGKFRLMVGCVCSESQTKGGGNLGTPACRVSIGELMQIVEAEMVEVYSPLRWCNQMNAFDKKDAMYEHARRISIMLGSSTVVCRNIPRGSLQEAVIEAISPFASEVWTNVGD